MKRYHLPILLSVLLAGLLLASAQTLKVNSGEPFRAAADADSRYAPHSVLADGHWAKVRIPASGFYELTDELLWQAGFDNPAKVKVYGYGGARQPQRLTADYLRQTDDLKEVPTSVVNGRRLFYGVGPVGWDSPEAELRNRNNYSSYGYYFLTDNGEEAPALMDSLSFADKYYPQPEDYHTLYEVDDYAWFHGGRNLYDAHLFTSGSERSYRLPLTGNSGMLTVQMSYNYYSDMAVIVDGDTVGHLLIDNYTTKTHDGLPAVNKVDTNRYSVAVVDKWTFPVVKKNSDTLTVTLKELWGHDMRLDYISLRSLQPRPIPDLSVDALPVPELVDMVPNQDRHADGPADMVIIMPASRQLEGEALRLKELHETYDQLRVTVVAADELYNEFSSGTPDANAYRRYLKMLYDRAETSADRPRYLLLLGDAAWDNRMVISDWRTTSPDDFLLSYESDNSMSETECYLTDDYFCILEDDKGDNVFHDLADAAVGRLPARTADEAKILVDKVIGYRLNTKAGDWQNTLCFMADDGNVNLHMEDAEAVIDSAAIASLPYKLNKIYWDGYPAVLSASGSDIPDVRALVHDQMRNGALIMNYTGHGNAISLSKESIILRADFDTEGLGHLPLWFLAACDIQPYNTQEPNIGETAMLSKTGGAIAVISTVHTVYAQLNRILNKWVMRYLLGTVKGDDNVYSIGEALRLAKKAYYNERRKNLDLAKPNHLQYSLLGDPALCLRTPQVPVVIDRINGLSINEGEQRLAAGSVVTVEGHVVGQPGFQGLAALTVCDVEQTVTGRNNEQEVKNWKPFTWKQRPTVIFHGADSVRQGQFSFSFAVPKDITYSDNRGMFYVYVVNDERTLMGHGTCDNFSMGSGSEPLLASDGPEITCYLANPLFTSGDVVGESPYFYAEIYDPDGINVSGSGIGHDLELIIDGKLSYTYNLNSYFDYVFGDYRRGSVGYQIPALPAGEHVLLFRVWDVLNNSSLQQLSFVVSDGQTASPEASAIKTVSRPSSDLREIYNLKGQSLSGRSASGLVIVRQADGTVKKKVVGRQ